LRSLLFNLWFYPGTLVFAIGAFFVSFASGPPTMRSALRLWTAFVLLGVRLILRGRIVVLGREALPASGRPALIVAKHQSELDAILFLNMFPDAGAIAMQELANFPFTGRILRQLGYILVPVSGPAAGRTRAVVEGAGRVHGQGRPILIYPEGTLMSLGAKERYHTGVFRIYAALGVPAQPVANSLGVIWPRREWRKTAHATGGIRFLPEIPPGLGEAEFMERLETEIETATMALIEAHAAPGVAAVARDRKARGVANED
jgi:1-acyl-sn-glycerol-3-phosphate acyltransferase